MLRLENIHKNFSGTTVLSDFSLDIPEGGACALLGLSGSGKTTALKIACGLHRPDSGRAFVAGTEVTPAHLARVRSCIGYVIQDGGLFPHLTARQNIELVARQEKWPSARIDSRVGELCEMTKISQGILERYPRELSGGQRQRIGIIRALVPDPPVFLMDEPLGALDPITRSELQEELRELFRRLKKTVLLVTHDLFEAGYLADRIVLLNHGRAVQSGTMRELIDAPASDFVRRFVRSQHAGGPV